MRVRITEPLHGSIDGIRIDRFQVGAVYEVGVSLACYLMAMRAAEPVTDQIPALTLPAHRQLFGPDPASRTRRRRHSDEPDRDR